MNVYREKPEAFIPDVEVAACYLQHGERFLLLCKEERWGFPAGKLRGEESPEEAARRELFEETGIAIDTLEHKERFYVAGRLAFTFHLYTAKLDQACEITLSDEHSAHAWVTKEAIHTLDLLEGEHALFHHLQ